MKKTLFSTAGLGLLVAFFLSFTLLNNWLLSGLRLDLTENKLYTVSEGSRKLLKDIDEPINLYFFFSDKITQGLPPLRNYALRVKELLQEFELLSEGKVILHIIDPEPFSEDEDKAAEFGLQAVPLQSIGENIYFGLVGTNAIDSQEIIPFFQPSQEEFLEYEISKLIHNLTHIDKPVIGLLTGIEIQGGFDMATRQPKPSLMVMDQISSEFSVETVSADVAEIPTNIDILMLVYGKDISQPTLYAIDQFVLAGGRLVVMVDPQSQFDPPDPSNPMAPAGASDLSPLFKAWGVQYDSSKIVADRAQALSVNIGNGKGPVTHVAMLGLNQEHILADDIVTSGLEKINFATAGYFSAVEEASSTLTPLLLSSSDSQTIPAMQLQFMRDPRELLRSFKATGEQYALAARVDGKITSAFPEGVEGADMSKHLRESDDAHILLVADTDWLSDRMWVQVQSFFGQRIATPWADNAGFLLNSLEHLGGNAALISIRSRGKYSRPFKVVDELKREAESNFLKQEQQLRAQLEEAESKLSELQQSKTRQNRLVLSPEQQQALLDFQKEKVKIRKQLRDVQHQLNEDIELLGTKLKIINIGLVPALLTLVVLAMGFRRRKITQNAST